MAPTSLEVEVPLIVSAPEEGRYLKLLKYLNRLVAATCPPDLQNDRDDIVQTVLIRLNHKLDEIESQLKTCQRLLEVGSGSPESEVARILQPCLKEIEKSWSRGRCEKIKRKLERCAAWAEKSDNKITPGEVLRLIKDSLAWLSKRGGKEIFSKVYIKRGVHWAILDTRKKFLGSPEVSIEEREAGFIEREASPKRISWQRSLIIREEVSDCLTRLDEAKRFPTFLALIGYEYNEIAQYFDLSIPQADSRIRRGKAFLRNCLKLKGVRP